MMMQNNPMMAIYAEMQKGADAITALERVAAQYPQVFQREKIEMAKTILGQRKKPNFGQIVQNMAKERGTTVEEVVRSIGVKF